VKNINVRRKLIVAFGAGALAAPFGSIAQQREKVRRIAVLMGYAESDPEARLRLAAFKEGLALLGWVDGRNLKIDLRWTAGDVNRASAYAKELVALQPEVILSNTTPVTTAFQRETRTIPIVFTIVSDPIGSGFVKTLARPGGNITGYINFESMLVEKWLQLLKEIAPRVTRVAVMFNPDTAPYAEYYLRPLNTAAPKLGVKAYSATVRSESEIQKAIAELGREPNGGLIAMTDSFLTVHRKPILELTAQHKIPAVYWAKNMAEEGGLLAYGVDYADLFRRAATYVDKIFKGAKPSDLPVEQPTKFELVINRKTAKALGLTIPQSLLISAEKVIE
jgi:putative tryptophan/tyrosine transport system substrate-binding protein